MIKWPGGSRERKTLGYGLSVHNDNFSLVPPSVTKAAESIVTLELT